MSKIPWRLFQQWRNIIENFNLKPIIDKLDKQERLYKLIEKFSNVDLHPSKIDNHQMGTIYEELIRRFSEESMKLVVNTSHLET